MPPESRGGLSRPSKKYRPEFTPVRPLPLLLLTCCLLSLATVAEAGGSGEERWYVQEYERAYVEALAIIAMVFIAILFDAVWHAVEEKSASSYLYGDTHKQLEGSHVREDGDKHMHHRLYKVFVERMGAEFMTLGILAFLIFFTNNMKGFDKLAELVGKCPEADRDCFHFPVTPYEWLHMAEETHIKLFLGMMFYFGIIIVVVRNSVEKIKTWERLRLRRLRDQSQGKHRALRHVPELDVELGTYMLWRDFFILKIAAWTETRPEAYTRIIELLGLGETDHTDAEEFNKEFDAVLEERFSLSAYLSLNLEAAVSDSIEVHWTTWMAVVLTFGIFAMFHRLARWRLSFQVFIFIGVCFLIFGTMIYMSKKQHATIRQYTKQKVKLRAQSTRELEHAKKCVSSVASRLCTPVTPDLRGGIHQQYNTETVILRVLQVFLFLISYVFASTLVSFVMRLDEYELTEQPLIVLCFIVLYAILAKFLPRLLPPFVAIMAIPPYVDNDNLETLFHVLVTDNMTWTRLRRDHSVFEAVRTGQHTTTSQKTDALLELAEMMGVQDHLRRRLKDHGKPSAQTTSRDIRI